MGDALRVRDALEEYYTAHGLPPDGGAGRWYFVIRVGRVSIPVPNPGVRKRALLYHDVHHLVTGYNTVFSDGEMVIAGHEIAAGCGRFAFAWLVNLWMFALGLMVTPRRMFAAFVRGRRCGSLYRHGRDFVDLSVGEVRGMLGLDRPAPTATLGDRARFAAWGAVAWAVILGCAGIVAVAGWGVVAGVAALVGRGAA